MEEELSAGSPASSATEAGGNVAGLLDGMAAVLAHLRQVSQTESSIAASMKSTPEVCAGILGAFLVVCQKLLARGAQVDRTWVEAVVDLWKGSIWGSANSKKVGLFDLLVSCWLTFGRLRRSGPRSALMPRPHFW